MSLITASAHYSPSADTRKLTDLYCMVKAFAAIGRAQHAVYSEAMAIVPVDTGALADSLKEEPLDDNGLQVIAQVSANMPYAGFVEFGTGLRGSGTYPYDLPQAGVPKTGSWIYDYRNVGWKGMVAQPYLRPALDAARSQVLAEFGK